MFVTGSLEVAGVKKHFPSILGAFVNIYLIYAQIAI